MKENNNYKGIVNICITAVIIFIQSALFYLTWELFYNDQMIYSPFYNKGLILLVLVYVLMYIAFSNIYGGYKIGYYRVSDVIYSQILTLIFVNTITYIEVSLMDRRLLNPSAFIGMTIIQIIVTILWAYISNRFYYKVFKPMNVVVVYGNENVDIFMDKMKKRWDKYDVTKLIDIDYGIDFVLNEVEKYDAVVLYDIESSTRNKILKECYKKSIIVYTTPKISDIIISNSDEIHLFDTPLFLSKNLTLSYEEKFIKRFMDILISLIAIIITLPIMLIVSICIKLYDGGPIIFKQQRLTINNDTFWIYKFRSMIINAEKDGVARLASQNDKRITPIGKFIRKVRFDELPQLFNVLKGDMSIVGPRPERPEIALQYIRIIPEFEFRTKVKAGLTGYAQIMGKYNTTAYDKLKLDLMYIGKFSIYMDFKIMLMTIKYLFTPSNEESTEGIKEDQILAGREFCATDED